MINIDELLELLNNRCSVRSYKTCSVEREKIELMLKAAQLAPSAVNYQPWQFIVAEQGGKLHTDIQSSYNRDWFKTAPLYIVICGNHNESWHRSFDNKDHCDIDVSIAIQHICLAATAQGLGSCWVCNFNPTTLKETLALAPEIEPIAILPIGYLVEGSNPAPKKRKPINEITKWGD